MKRLIKLAASFILFAGFGFAQTSEFPLVLRDSNGTVIFKVETNGEVTATSFISKNPNNPTVGSIELCQANGTQCSIITVGPQSGILYLVPKGQTVNADHEIITLGKLKATINAVLEDAKIQ